ncbi:cytochrome P450 3A24 [Patella vulgata]|uniref:cytochrome P450 3A24 n=1 Tax=Patella vulgata TaxID=6465 RepID=UPI0024A86C66|nr:cytochrome P450 3A24 [Patella vulgata]
MVASSEGLDLCFNRHLHRHFNQFHRLGIRGPRPSLVCGNLAELLQKGQHQAIQDWTSEYGRIFGYFEGYTPVITVGEPDLLKDILVKDYPNFKRRKSFPLAPKKSLGLFLEEGDQWRKSRSLLTPAFSSGKMKQMFSIMNDCTDLMITNLDEKADRSESFDIYSMFQCLTLDVIGRCAFGLRTDAQTDANDPFLTQIRTLFDGMTKSIILPLVMFMPFLRYFIFAVKNIVVIFGMNPIVWLRQQMTDVIKMRREMGTGTKIVDLVQLMLYPELKARHKHLDSAMMKEPMTNREVVAQSITFLLAGYETTSTGLAFMSHMLAMNPDIQNKLLTEIDEKIGEKEVDYESVQKLSYFDQVFDEVCRMYPTASLIVTRRASETKEYHGITIPEGINIQANIWALHRDATYWQEPETFDPERFSQRRRSEIQGYTYLPFGAGPRACIGMRFAILETKIAIARVLQKFEILKGDNMKEVLDVEARGAIVPKDPVNVRVVKRVKTDYTISEE